jgi:hypothetical protein
MPSPCSIYISGLVDITVKKGRWSAYEVKTEKSYPHVPSIMRGIIEARLGDTVGMNRKVIFLFSAILSAAGGGGIGPVVADSRLGSSLSKITFRFIPMINVIVTDKRCTYILLKIG